MNVALAIGAVLDLAALEVGNSLADVGGDGAGLGVRHKTTRAELTAELANLGHEIGGGDDEIEIHHSAFNLRKQIVGANEFGACVASGLRGIAGGKHCDANIGTGAGRKGNGATNHLVGLAGVNAQTHRQFDGFIELRRCQRLHLGDSFGQAMLRGVVETRCCCVVLLTVLCHFGSLGSGTTVGAIDSPAGRGCPRHGGFAGANRYCDQRTSMPMERAVPAT